MLHGYLCDAIVDLEKLIDLTNRDLIDIKEARHEGVFARNLEKSTLISSFHSKKKLIEQEILSLRLQAEDTDLSDVIDKEASELLALMRVKLEDLRSINAYYARIVLAVSEFYSSLFQRLFPHEICGYSPPKQLRNILLTIEA